MSLSDEWKKRQAITRTITSTTTVATGPTNLFGLLVSHDGVNDPVVTVYDNTSATGTPIFSREFADTDGPGFIRDSAIRMVNGLHVVISGTIGTGAVTLLYNQRYVMEGGE